MMVGRHDVTSQQRSRRYPVIDTIPADPVHWTRLSEAAAIALHIHADQRRKGTETPYISHLLAVSANVLEHGGDEDQACVGLSHDAIKEVPSRRWWNWLVA